MAPRLPNLHPITNSRDPWVAAYLQVRERDLTRRDGKFIVEGKVTLGTLIRIGMQFLLSGDWWILWIPTVFLVALVVSINILGDFLRDVFNPRLR